MNRFEWPSFLQTFTFVFVLIRIGVCVPGLPGHSINALADDYVIPTAPVADIQIGPIGSYPSILVNANGTLFFTADDGVNGEQLWKNDGTTGAVMLGGPPDSSIMDLTDVNGTLFFTAKNDAGGRELWKSNGEPGDTELVKDVQPGWGSTEIRNLTNVNGTLFFVGREAKNGRELWRSDGTPDGTVMVKDINYSNDHAFASPGFSNFLVNVNGTLFFAATNGYQGTELWKTNGTEAGTVLVKDIHTGYYMDSDPSDLINVNGTLFFVADNGEDGPALWKSDGTTAGTTLVKDINTWDQFNPYDNLTNINGTLFFSADDSPNYSFPGEFGRELWKSDGTTAGTMMVKDINPGSEDSSPYELTDVNGMLFFVANDGTNGVQLWKSDGTKAGTEPVRVRPGSSPHWLTNFNGTLFYQDRDVPTGAELWKSNGTTTGTERFMDINPGQPGSSPSRLTNVNGTLFFNAYDGVTGYELWAVASQSPPVAIADSTANTLYAATDLDPINTFTGELFSRKPADLDLGGPMPLYFQRYYASYLRRSHILGDLGSNWRHNFDARLYWVGNTITYVTSDGRVTEFLQDLQTQEWSQLTNTDTPYQLYTAGGENASLYDPQDERVYTFDFTTSSVIIGKLVRIEDGHGNAHTVTYDLETGHIQSVSDGLGRTLTFSYNDDAIPKISEVSDGTRSISFQYTDPIDTEYLTLVTDGLLGVTEYTYEDTSTNADHALMISTSRPRGNVPYYQTFFDTSTGSSGKVATQTDADGNEFSFDYTGLDTTLTDPFGNTRIHTHTATGEFSSRQDQEGEIFTMGSDVTGRRNSLTDRLGDTTIISYDEASGNLENITNADGSASDFSYSERTFENHTLYDLTLITHADSTTESFVYDTMGNAISHTDQAGNTATATFNANGQPLTVTNAAGGTRTNVYNADGTLASRTDPAGNTSIFEYDDLKRLNLIIFADGSTQALTYNDLDQIISTTDGNGNTTTLDYDANGNLAITVDPLGNTTTFGYDDNDRLLSMTDHLGNSASLTYHPLDKVATITNENGDTNTFGYDILGRHISTTDPLGYVWSQTYDAEAILASSTDPLGNTTNFTSDAMGRITQVTSPLGSSSSVVYDAMGRIATTTDPLSNITTFNRDARGLLTGIDLPGGSISTEYSRNSLGNITQITDPNGNKWQSGFDNKGLCTSRTDPLGNTTEISYDNRNRPVVITYADGTVHKLGYDPAGNLVSSSYDGGSLVFNYTYDASNRLLSANDGPGTSDTLTQSYDAAGRISNSNGIAIARDAGGRIISMTLKAGKTVTYAYDANDNLISVADWTGAVTTFSYDAASRLTSINRPAGNNVVTSYSYDNDSQLIGVRENQGATSVSAISLDRDVKGQITAATRNTPQSTSAASLSGITHSFNAASQVSTNGFVYDALGRLTDDGTKTYTWDAASRLTSVTEGTATTTYTYNAMRQRLSRSSGSIERRYVWNTALNLNSVSIERDGIDNDLRYYIHTPAGVLLYAVDAISDEHHFYHFDEMGNTIAVTDDNGDVIGSYAYSPYGKLMASTGGLDNLFTWQGQYGIMVEGNGLYYIRARYYDSTIERFISRDPVQSLNPKSVNPYQYSFSNPINFSDPTGLFVFGWGIEIGIGKGIGFEISIDFVIDTEGHYGIAVSPSVLYGPFAKASIGCGPIVSTSPTIKDMDTGKPLRPMSTTCGIFGDVDYVIGVGSDLEFSPPTTVPGLPAVTVDFRGGVGVGAGAGIRTGETYVFDIYQYYYDIFSFWPTGRYWNTDILFGYSDYSSIMGYMVYGFDPYFLAYLPYLPLQSQREIKKNERIQTANLYLPYLQLPSQREANKKKLGDR